jgi:hypothetical protein
LDTLAETPGAGRRPRTLVEIAEREEMTEQLDIPHQPDLLLATASGIIPGRE